jgi:hypothetical protein
MASNHYASSSGVFTSKTNNHQRASSVEPSASGSKKTRQLRVESQLSDYSVVCGRGNGIYNSNHVGNRRFRSLASMFIERYSQANTRMAKSAIISEITVVIRQAGGNFCKYKKGVWLEVGDLHAREKVGALLRDLLHTQYRSSTKAKVGRLTTQKNVKQKQNQNQLSDQKQLDDTQNSDDSSTTSSCWGRSKDSLGFEFWLEDNFFEIDVF